MEEKEYCSICDEQITSMSAKLTLTVGHYFFHGMLEGCSTVYDTDRWQLCSSCEAKLRNYLRKEFEDAVASKIHNE